jgi:hypothetical protein
MDLRELTQHRYRTQRKRLNPRSPHIRTVTRIRVAIRSMMLASTGTLSHKEIKTRVVPGAPNHLRHMQASFGAFLFGR